MDVIPHNNRELLERILGDAYSASCLDAARNVQQQLADNCDLVDLPVFHHFAPNVYMRQMDACAGTLMVTKMHRTEHFLIVLKGTASVYSGDGLLQVAAPQIIRTMPGTKRVIYFHEDSSWMTVHPTSLTDLDEIEKTVIVPESEIDDFLKAIGHQSKELIA